ncbi:MAG: hypothetical protein ACI8TX_004009, partial [Hyphomicrobiaceae bacterium]
CTAGVCAGSAIDCSGSADQCNAGVCNPGTGVCEAAPVGDGTGCDDGDLCTGTDVCTAGVCAGSVVDCSGSADQCNTGACNPGTGACEATPIADDTDCDDASLCTTGDVCTAGGCLGTPTDCSAFDAECGTGTCNAGTGDCEAIPLADGVDCDDGLFCTTDDVCTAGTCDGAPLCGEGAGCLDTCSEAEQACRVCGRPFSNDRCIVNAVVILQGSVGLRPCEPCFCDVNDSATVTPTDALLVLNVCVENPVVLTCPDRVATEPVFSSTTTMPASAPLGITTTTLP